MMGISEGQEGDNTDAVPSSEGQLLLNEPPASPEGLVSSAESSVDAVPSSEGRLSLTEPPERLLSSTELSATTSEKKYCWRLMSLRLHLKR